MLREACTHVLGWLSFFPTHRPSHCGLKQLVQRWATLAPLYVKDTRTTHSIGLGGGGSSLAWDFPTRGGSTWFVAVTLGML